MKKTINKIHLVPILALGLLISASCKKNYSCECVLSSTGSVSTFDMGKQKKKDAESLCKSREVSANGVSYTCTVKK